MRTLTVTLDADGIALVTLDVPGKSMNTITEAVVADLRDLAARLKEDASIKGAVIASGKPSGFCAGADLGDLAHGRLAPGSDPEAADPETAGRARFTQAFALSAALRAIETCGKPVATAIEGVAMGGGLEIALATHHRVVADDPKLPLGLPEAKVGLLPGAGGTQRMPRLMGAMAALPFLLEGKSMTPAEALAAKVIHRVVPKGETVAAATDWVRAANPTDAVAPWDKKDFRVPGGPPYGEGGKQVFMLGTAMLRKQSFGNYPAQLNIMRAVYEGLQVPIDAGLRIETRYFVNTIATPQARAMMRTLFGSMQALGKGAARPKSVPKSDAARVAVLGAGMMGAGIAYVQAMAGIRTVLIDQTEDAAVRGKQYSVGLLDKSVARGRTTRAAADAALALIEPTADYAAVTGADLVVEAVFEDRAVKAEATRRAESHLGADAVFGSNTSTLPITGLAEASSRPENFIGIHFFSPVDRMGLVEIITGEKTSDATLARTIDYVVKIRKTPIVVGDSCGFYTSRCFGTYLSEGLEMLAEGILPALIDNVGRMTGMPRGPLEMHDDVALDLSVKVRAQARADLGDRYEATAGDALVERMVKELGRFGRKNGKGFYDYPAEGPKRLWPGLADLAPPREAADPRAPADPALVESLRTRLLYRQAVEAARCFAEGVVRDPRDADVGAVLAWGFAPWTGGPLSLIEGVGLEEFVRSCDHLAQAHGPRFAPPPALRERAARGEGFYGEVARAA